MTVQFHDPAWQGAAALAARYAEGKLSPVEVTKAQLERIAAVNPKLNAFQLIDGERALARAAESETRWIKRSPLSPLDGQPVTIKDIVPTLDWPTLSGSRTVDPQPGSYDAPAVARLREAGAIILGKTTTPEFGWKGMTDSPVHGVTRNPWDLQRTPGGSSGGAGACIAAGIGTLAFGTDGGGSIRIPSAHCGIFGIKPTFGRVPHFPHSGPFSTLVAGGPMTRSVGDAALMLNQLAKPDARDWHALPYDGADYTKGLADGVQGMRIAFSPNFGETIVDRDIAAAVARAANVFSQMGAVIEQVGAVTAPMRPRFEKYWLAGFGYLLGTIPREKHGLMDGGLLELAERGLAVTRDEYFAGHMARVELGRQMSEFHTRYDLLLMPTMAAPPPPASMAYHVQGNDRWEHATPFTVPFNYTGQPAASICCGISPLGLPIGLQIVGPKYAEAKILRAAAAFERAQPMLWPAPQIEKVLR